MISPSELDLPYSSWRPGQSHLLSRLLARGPRFRGITAPTGAGKSAIYVGLASILASAGKRVAILTATRGLQDQLSRDFSTLLFDVRGQSNYHCIGFDKDRQFYGWTSRRQSCDEGPCHLGQKCVHKAAGCLYYDAVRQAQLSPIVATNYSMWFAAYAYGDGLGNFDCLITDEAHDVPDELSGFLEIKIPLPILARHGLLPPKKVKTMGAWREWAGQSVRKINRDIETNSVKLDGEMSALAHLSVVKELRQVQLQLQSIEASSGEWLHWTTGGGDSKGALSGPREGEPKEMCWAPIWPTPYVEKHLWRSIPRVISVSATLRPKTMDLLSVDEGERELYESAHPFSLERRPIYLLRSIDGRPVPRVQYNWSSEDQTWWVECIDRIIDLWPNEKGLVHTVSYGRMKMLAERSRHRSRLWTHWSGNTREKVEAFKRSRGNGVFVSPSLTTGWDFPDDAARFNIIAKVPFPDSTSPLVRARCNVDPDYRDLIAAVQMQQAAGRVVRNEGDWASTYIVDGHAGWFQWGRSEHFAQWYLDGVEDCEGLPEVRRF